VLADQPQELFQVGQILVFGGRVAALPQIADRRLVEGARAAADPEADAGKKPVSETNCSASASGAWLTASTPPVPTRMFAVAAATRASTTAGGKATMCATEWCSAYQIR
jgi:hypothetical protein